MLPFTLATALALAGCGGAEEAPAPAAATVPGATVAKFELDKMP
jgi:hypothetical protein